MERIKYHKNINERTTNLIENYQLNLEYIHTEGFFGKGITNYEKDIIFPDKSCINFYCSNYLQFKYLFKIRTT